MIELSHETTIEEASRYIGKTVHCLWAKETYPSDGPYEFVLTRVSLVDGHVQLGGVGDSWTLIEGRKAVVEGLPGYIATLAPTRRDEIDELLSVFVQRAACCVDDSPHETNEQRRANAELATLYTQSVAQLCDALRSLAAVDSTADPR